VLTIKILSLGTPERYAIRRMVTAILQEFQSNNPHLGMTICEVSDADQIGRYASVLVMPTLVINEKVVCSGRYPTRAEVVNWFHEALNFQ
jgi:hypothetical protein